MIDDSFGFLGEPLPRPDIKSRAIYLLEHGESLEAIRAKCKEHSVNMMNIRIGDVLVGYWGKQFFMTCSKGRTYLTKTNVLDFVSVEDTVRGSVPDAHFQNTTEMWMS